MALRTTGFLVATAALALGAGCRDDELYAGAFDMPAAAAVLDPSSAPVLGDREPVGFVANGVGGRIVMLALKQGRFLNDDATAAFLRTNDLPTGGLRLLTSVAPFAPSTYDVRVFAGDTRFGQLVEVPWIVGSEPVGNGLQQPVEGYASFYPPDLSAAGEGVTVDLIEVKKGYTTSERWTLTYETREGGYVVEGSRSGRQPTLAYPDRPFVAEERRIAFTIGGEPADGSRIVLDTWNGLVEHDVGGAPLELSMAPDQSALAMIVQDPTLDHAVVRWFDPAAGTVTGTVNLPDDARPHRMEWSEDGSELYVADMGRPSVWALTAGSIASREIPMPGPVLDVASLQGETREALFAASTDGRTLYFVDAATGEQIDQNALLPGVQGLPFDSPIQGIAALRQPHLQPQYDEDERRSYGRSIAISLAKGSTVFAHEDNGCLVQDSLGPRTASEGGGFSASSDYQVNFDSAVGPYLAQNGASARSVIVNPCGGIARSDSWTVRYDQLVGGWRVRSELTGDQTAIAYEDERYVSDGGEVSFTLRAGPSPSIDGMEFTFSVEAGIAAATGDADQNGEREVELAIPGDPVPFHYEVGSRDGDWIGIDDRPLVLLLGQTSDIVGRVDPQDATVDAAWQ